MLQGITLVPLGMELVDKRKLLLLSLYTVSFFRCISNHYSYEKKAFYRTFVYTKVNNSTE